jgi:hypothetical protein
MSEPTLLAVMGLQQTYDLAHSALPDAPVRDDLDATGDRPVRRRAAVVLRWLADRLEPLPEHPGLRPRGHPVRVATPPRH